jgi:hypothetical protein
LPEAGALLVGELTWLTIIGAGTAMPSAWPDFFYISRIAIRRISPGTAAMRPHLNQSAFEQGIFS